MERQQRESRREAEKWMRKAEEEADKQREAAEVRSRVVPILFYSMIL